MERYVRTGTWITNCGRFLLERDGEGWRIRVRLLYSGGNALDPIAETGILDRDARWATRAVALEAMATVCEAVAARPPGRLRLEGGWRTVDGSVDLHRFEGLWWAYLTGVPFGDSVSEWGFETRREATTWARRRQRGGLAHSDRVAVDSSIRTPLSLA